jgi:hypothetical protein
VRAVDLAVLGVLRTEIPEFPFFQGAAPSERDPLTGKVITTVDESPFAVYRSAVGDDDNPRLAGRKLRRSVPFWLTYIGEEEEQAKLAGETIRKVIQGRRIAVEGHRSWLIDLQESQRIWRDDEAVNPGGMPLYYGVDAYAMSITLSGTDFQRSTTP